MSRHLNNSIEINPLFKEDAETVSKLLQENIDEYEKDSTLLHAMMRRAANLLKTYDDENSEMYVAKSIGANNGTVVACAGIGSLHGLPRSEGRGEIRDLIVHESFRGNGIGTILINLCIEKCASLGYKQIYLETTPAMKVAQKLFLRTGFRPVTSTSEKNDSSETLPSYFIKELH